MQLNENPKERRWGLTMIQHPHLNVRLWLKLNKLKRCSPLKYVKKTEKREEKRKRSAAFICFHFMTKSN